jgi:hypothetical protein
MTVKTFCKSNVAFIFNPCLIVKQIQNSHNGSTLCGFTPPYA